MMSATKELMQASSRPRTVLSNKARRGSPRPSAVSSACPFSPRLCDEGTVVWHQHASSWRVGAVRSCDAGLVDPAEWPKKVSVCKRTVARLPVRWVTRMLGRPVVSTCSALKLASFYSNSIVVRVKIRDKHRISKSELFSVANDKDAIPAKAETTD